MSGKFEIGSKVRIVSPAHPWNGSQGVITGPVNAPGTGLDWRIRIERDDALNGHEAAAAEKDLRRLGEAR